MRNLIRISGISLALLLGLLAAPSLLADTIILKSGQVLEGEIVKETPEEIVLKVKFGTVRYDRKEIKKIIKASKEPLSKDASKLRDVVKLKSGEVHKCLLVKETHDKVIVDLIASGLNVSKAMLLRTTFAKSEVTDIKRLTDAERSQARKYLSDVEKEEKQDRVNEQEVILKPIEWDGKRGRKKVKIPAFQVEMQHFLVEANLKEDFLRKCVYRMGKVFNAFKEHFGVDRNESTKIKVILFNSMEEYYAAINNKVKNPAFYNPVAKLICGGCNVAKFERQIKEIRKAHKALNAKLQKLRGILKQAKENVIRQQRAYNQKIFKAGKTTPYGMALYNEFLRAKIQWQLEVGKYEKQIKKVEDDIYRCNQRNDIIFGDITENMFQTLYHEGFHAFVDNFLFSEEEAKHVPRWLHEGLAQYFEVAKLERGKLMLGQVDRGRMAKLKEWKKDGTLKPVSAIAAAGAEGFLVHTIGDLEKSTRHYLQSWCLVHWLGENNRLKKEYLNTYVRAMSQKADPQLAMAALSGLAPDALDEAIRKKLSYDFRLKSSTQDNKK